VRAAALPRAGSSPAGGRLLLLLSFADEAREIRPWLPSVLLAGHLTWVGEARIDRHRSSGPDLDREGGT
jgi:hypothetical protein